MNRFNLSFKGEIQPGKDPRQVKARFGKLFGIDDPARIERFFSGETILLRRNLDRKVAAEYFSKIRKLGAEAELVKVTDQAERAAEDLAEQKARERAWEDARRKAEEEATRRSAEEAQARQKAAEEENLRRAREEARRQAEEEEAKRKAAEEAARRKALEEEKKRKEAEQAARRKALEEERKRKEAEEAARRKALEEERKRKEAEQAARRKAAEEEAKRKAAEEAARRKAEDQARKATEAARRKAEKEEARRKAREEAARRRAEEKAKKEEQAARRRAEKEEARLRAEEEAAMRAAQQAELERQKAEEIAREKAVQAEARRKAAEEAARRREQLAETKRRQAEQAAKEKARKEQARKEAEQAAAREQERLQAEKQAQEQREKEAREQASRKAEAARREQEAHRRAMEEQAVQRAAQELSRQPSLKPAAAKVKTRLDLPQGKRTGSGRRQPGAPNLYSLRPFRNTAEVKSRVASSRQSMRRYLAIAALALAGILVLAGARISLPTVTAVTGASGTVVAPGQGPILLAGDQLLLHDRAGMGSGQLGFDELGVERLAGTMEFTASGDLLALGEPAGKAAGGASASTLLRCSLETPACSALSPDWRDRTIDTFAVQTLDDSLFLVDTDSGELMQTDPEGNIIATASLNLPPQPVIRLRSGLMFMNSASGPAVSVFRYDTNAFGEQLDEILLLPPPAVEAGQQQVRDFLWNAGSWWVTMANPETGSSGVYRFDPDWGYQGQVHLAADTQPEQLLAWGSKTLVRDSRRIPLQRFNASGTAEVPLESDLLHTLVDGRGRTRMLTDMGWRGAGLTLGLLFLGALALSWLQGTRALVYKARDARGAAPIDDIADQISWIDPLPDREKWFRRANLGFGMISLALVLAAIGAGVSAIEMAALLLALAGIAGGLVLLQRSPIGHIGVVQGQLLLVDHRAMYHLDGDARLQYRGAFLLIDDVAVFSGNALLPAFSPEQVRKQVMPLARGGVRVDRKTVLVKLLQGRHPLAQSIGISVAGLLLGILALALQWW